MAPNALHHCRRRKTHFVDPRLRPNCLVGTTHSVPARWHFWHRPSRELGSRMQRAFAVRQLTQAWALRAGSSAGVASSMEEQDDRLRRLLGKVGECGGRRSSACPMKRDERPEARDVRRVGSATRPAASLQAGTGSVREKMG